MTLIVKRVKSKGSNGYYKLVNQKRVNGKIVQKYVKYLGMDPKIEEQDIVWRVIAICHKSHGP